MRKIYLVAIAAVLAFTACSKQGPMGPMGPQGPKGEDGVGSTFNVVNFDVPQAAWQYSENKDNNYFFADVKMPELTEEVFDGSMVSVYRTFDYDSKNASQQVLPSVRMFEQTLSNGTTVYYTETIDYDYGIGWLRIYFTVSDFIYEDDLSFVPEAMTFRAVIIN